MAHLIPTTDVLELQPFINAEVLGVSEIHTARTIVDALRSGTAENHFLDYLSVAIAVWAPVHGHVCADIANIEQQVRREMVTLDNEEIRAKFDALQWPARDTWVQHLSTSPLVSHGKLDYTKPLVLNGDLLYLTRQFIDEEDVARAVGQRITAAQQKLPAECDKWIAEVLSSTPDEKQANAIRNVLRFPTSILLGGPGTGKTFTIAGMIHALLSEHETQSRTEPLRIALAAPTAKAAQQMRTSITSSLDATNHDGAHTFPQRHRDHVLRICETSSTIHRLLGWLPGNRGRFVHDKFNTLPFDVVVIDEVSMISLPLMARLLEALPPTAKLVLVGDPAQLQSVEAGAVLPQIASLATNPELPIVTLERNRRQEVLDTNNKPVINRIGELALAMRPVNGSVNSTEVLNILTNGGPDITFIALDNEKPDPTSQAVRSAVAPFLQSYVSAATFAKQGDGVSALSALAQVRVLCAHREGEYGVGRWNSIVSNIVGIRAERGSVGQVLLNTKNDIRSGLVNGDTCIVVQQGASRLAIFPAPASTATGNVRAFIPSALDAVEVAFAMTVHKAQGSQFDTVVVVVPPETSPLLQRELLYTAITRARHKLVVIASPSSIETAVANTIQRASGLAERILAKK